MTEETTPDRKVSVRNPEYRENALAKVREALDFFDANPEIPLPFDFENRSAQIFGCSREDALALKAAVGRIEKEPADNVGSMKLTATLPHGAIIEMFVQREAICTARVVGKKTIKVPDPDAPVALIEREVDEIEWDCEPLLAD